MRNVTKVYVENKWQKREERKMDKDHDIKPDRSYLKAPMSNLGGWFAGPKGENADWFEGVLSKIAQDYYSWRRNYFPEDGVVLGSADRRQSEEFSDEFEDRLFELLGRLKADFPFQSPRYAAHMVAEQTLPSIAAYFAAMLYNPNNVSKDAAPVTVRLELEACEMISQMVGFPAGNWGHLTGGGTVANLEALWVARTVAYLPEVIADIRSQIGLPECGCPAAPLRRLQAFAAIFQESDRPVGDIIRAYTESRFCLPEVGMAQLLQRVPGRPVVLVPESHHYCFEKCLDVLGLGRKNLISVPVDSDFRMNIAALRRIMTELDAEQARVIAVVAVTGSTEEGAVDPVDQVLDLRSEREAQGLASFWIHVDGAYGGYLRTMTQPDRMGLGEPKTQSRRRGQPIELKLELPEKGACSALERMGEVDSVTIDPHKLGYIPYPAGAILFHSDLVKPLVRQEAPYLEDQALDPERERKVQGVGMYILEGSKPGAAAAAVWLSHKLIPLTNEGHGQIVRQSVRHACELHALLQVGAEGRKVKAVPLCAPGSNIVCFAFRPQAPASLAELNRLNRAIYEQFTVLESSDRRVYDQKFFLSRTSLTLSTYGLEAVRPFLGLLQVQEEEYGNDGVFLLRSVLMNPWYSQAKARGRFFLSELVDELYDVAESLISS